MVVVFENIFTVLAKLLLQEPSPMMSAQTMMFVTLEYFKVLNELLMDHIKQFDNQQALIQKMKNTIIKQNKEIGQLREEMNDANFIEEF